MNSLEDETLLDALREVEELEAIAAWMNSPSLDVMENAHDNDLATYNNVLSIEISDDEVDYPNVIPQTPDTCSPFWDTPYSGELDNAQANDLVANNNDLIIDISDDENDSQTPYVGSQDLFSDYEQFTPSSYPSINNVSSEDETSEITQRPAGPIIYVVSSDEEPDQPEQIGLGGNDRLFELVTERRGFSKKFNVYTEILEVRVNPNVARYPGWLERFVVQILRTARERFHILDDEMLRIEISHPDLQIPILHAFTNMGDLTVEDILASIEKVMQSAKTFTFDDRVKVSLIYVPRLRGGGRPLKGLNVDFLASKVGRTILAPIKTDDSLQICFALSLILGINEVSRNRVDPSPAEKEIYVCTLKNPKRNPLQLRRALELCDRAGVNTAIPCGLTEWRLFQEVLKEEYKIFVYDFDSGYDEIFEGDAYPDTIPLRLLLNGAHFYYIRLMHSLFNRAHFCYVCHKAYNTRDHKCVSHCFRCKTSCTSTGKTQKCADCRRSFQGGECFDNHKKSKDGVSVCESFVACPICYVTIPRNGDHVCGNKKCANCCMEVPVNHKCYLKPLEPDEKEVRFYVFYDFETFLNPDKVHVPCLCIAHRVCAECISLPLDEPCNACGSTNPNREYVFHGESCLRRFCEWFLEKEDIEKVSENPRKRGKVTVYKHRSTRYIAHNAGSFDLLFILKFLCSETNLNPKLVGNGTKISSMTVGSDMKFIDSLKFMPIPLKKFSDTFKLPVCKGIFPYSFLARNTLDYIGPLPEFSFYDSRSLSPKGLDELRLWYNKRKGNDHFDTRKELEEYCRDDVNLLRGGCGAFLKLFDGLTAIPAYHSSATIAGLAMRVYRTNFLPKLSIATTQPSGLLRARKQSILAIRFLQYLEFTENIEIKHARNGGEHRVQSLAVDGYYLCPFSNRNTVVEILGCVFHGCILCQKNREGKHPYNDKTMNELYREHQARTLRLEGENLSTRMFWECEIKLIKKSANYKAFSRSVPVLKEPLEVRDSFYGGRVNAIRLYKAAENGEEILYKDITSLYPFVNKTKRYPIGHPQVILKNFKNVDQYFGFIKCAILPPQNLYIPVLPLRYNGKNVFPLCAACASVQQSCKCNHSESERLLSGTWFSEEILVAMRRGYVVKDIFEVHHYPHTRQYDPTMVQNVETDVPVSNVTDEGIEIPEDELYKIIPEKDLFSDYINLFLKIKTEASGYPIELDPKCDCCDDLSSCSHIDWESVNEGRDRFIEEFFAREHIQLDKENIVFNSSLRFIAKLFLNSLWGKFSERVENRSKLMIISSAKVFYDLLYHDKKTVVHIEVLNDAKLLVSYRDDPENCSIPDHVNVAIGTVTTAYGRLELYKYLDILNDRVLYFDTDSIIYTQRPGEETIPCGRYLGDFTDEIPQGSTIVEFCSTGPKSYALKILNKKTGKFDFTVKSKGITLNHETSKLVNFDTMVQMIEDQSMSVHLTYPDSFHRTRGFDIFMKDRTKTLRFKYDKRVQLPGKTYRTIPYGYRGPLRD